MNPRRWARMGLSVGLAGLFGALLAACAPLTPAQKEAVELRQYCSINPGRDPERCMVFLNPPGL